jgi:SPP1 gp7 family putative phage head morphogenesis protein
MALPLGVRNVTAPTKAEIAELRRAMIKKSTARRIKLRPAGRPLEPSAQVAAYMRMVVAYQRDIREAIRNTVMAPVMAGLIDGLRYDATATDVMGPARIQVTRKLTRAEIERNAERHANAIDDFNAGEISRQVETIIGIRPPKIVGTEKQLKAFTRDNVELIQSIGTRALDEVSDILAKGSRIGSRVETIAKEIERRLDVAESRARLIARDQVNKLHGELTQFRQTSLGAKSYVWRTSLDSRVRDDHAEREGDDFDWSDPPEDGHPGQPVQCRCSAQFKADDLLKSLGL